MVAFFLANRGKFKFSLRMTIAALLSILVGAILNLSQVYWAALSAVIVIQGSIGGSYRAGIYRLLGTVGGAFWGAVVAVLIPHGTMAALALALVAAVAPLALLTAFRPDWRVAPITAIIVLMGSTLPPTDPFDAAIERVLEISVGSLSAVLVALVVLPARAHALLVGSASKSIADMAAIVCLLQTSGARGVPVEALRVLHNDLRVQIAQTEARAAEASVERQNRLADGPDPESLVRTLRRLRHDIAMLGRVLREPFPETLREALEPPLLTLLGTLAGWLTAVSQSLPQGEQPTSPAAVQAALEDYRATLDKAIKDGRLSSASADTQRIYALLFVCGQFIQNLQDLANRAGELTSERRVERAAEQRHDHDD
jgi:uncharacterized membrane protein YccC